MRIGCLIVFCEHGHLSIFKFANKCETTLTYCVTGEYGLLGYLIYEWIKKINILGQQIDVLKHM